MLRGRLLKLWVCFYNFYDVTAGRGQGFGACRKRRRIVAAQPQSTRRGGCIAIEPNSDSVARQHSHCRVIRRKNLIELKVECLDKKRHLGFQIVSGQVQLAADNAIGTRIGEVIHRLTVPCRIDLIQSVLQYG